MVDDDQVRLTRNPLVQKYFLLIAAAEKPRHLLETWRAHSQSGDVLPNQVIFGRVIDERPAGHAPQGRARDICTDSRPKHQPHVCSIFWYVGDSGHHRVLRSTKIRFLSSQENIATIGRRRPKYTKGHFTASGADKSGHRDDLPAS